MTFALWPRIKIGDNYDKRKEKNNSISKNKQISEFI